MDLGSDRARSHSWWKKLAERDAWGMTGGGGRVGPPGPDAIPGIAKLFGTDETTVRQMIAADWFGVHPDQPLTPGVQRIVPLLTGLSLESLDVVAALVVRLNGLEQSSRTELEPHPVGR